MNPGSLRFGIHFLLLTLMLVAPTACRRNEVNPGDPVSADAIEQKARRYLQQFLHTGESATNIIAEFGPPFDQDRTESGELRMDFFLALDNREARAAGVGGLTAFFRNNELSRWYPMLTPAFSDISNKTISANQAMFKSDRPVIEFDLVREVKSPHTTYINTAGFPSLGYIPESPDLGVRSGDYTTYDDSSNSLRTIMISLPQVDADTLNALTSNNIGKKLAVVAGSQVVMVAPLRSPLSNTDLMLRLPDPAYSTLLSALRENATRTVH